MEACEKMPLFLELIWAYLCIADNKGKDFLTIGEGPTPGLDDTTSLDLCGGKPTLKKKSIAKSMELKEKFDLCDISRIRNPKTKRYTFRQKHVFGLIQRHHDYFCISNSMQVSVKKADVLASLLNDHLPITFSYRKNKESNRGTGFWKFNNSLIEKKNMLNRWKNLLQIL